MLGLLEIDKSLRKTQIDYKRVFDNKILCVNIPSIKRRHVKRATQLLRPKRVIVGEDYDIDALSKKGMMPINPKKLYRHLTGQIYKKALYDFKIPADKAYVSVKSGRVGNIERFGLDEIIRNTRHISITSSDSKEISEYMLQCYGISSIAVKNRANIVIEMYENDFLLYLKTDGGVFRLKEIVLKQDVRLSDIPPTHLKSAYLALIEEGRLRAKEIHIDKLHFTCQN